MVVATALDLTLPFTHHHHHHHHLRTMCFDVHLSCVTHAQCLSDADDGFEDHIAEIFRVYLSFQIHARVFLLLSSYSSVMHYSLFRPTVRYRL